MTPLGFRIAVRMTSTRAHGTPSARRSVLGAFAAALLLQAGPLAAQQPAPMRPGEAFVTRFSGTMSVPGPGGTAVPAINPRGVVGSVIDLRNPGQPPQGQHWIGEPQRLLVTAAEVGQIFGTTLDDANPPNIYVAATSAFGLHRSPDNAQWMQGMWGPGGPGGIYRIGPATNYRPQLLTQIALNGRQNSGAALGNLAYDRWNRQLYVSDLETGMIHRIRITDGADLGSYDHGVRGRSNFFDAGAAKQASLPAIPFDPALGARVNDCATGRFDNSPECWNLAASGRRVWGVGVWRSASGDVRLYYSAWSTPAQDPDGWLKASEEDKRNSVWSVGINADGSFNVSSIRREFVMPDFFVGTEDIARAGYSQPVSDIAFPICPGLPLMLVAERGGIRNLGLGEPSAFTSPHEARALRYELHQDGVWRPIGRFEVGFYNRSGQGEPRIRANCGGGISFGPGFSNRWTANQNQPDNFVWITGDSLCSPDGPCNLPATGENETGDDSEVHGIQGLREDLYDEVAPAAAYGLAPEHEDAAGQTPAVGLDEAFLIDLNINMTPGGDAIVDELVRNDTSLTGDIVVYQQCAVQAAGVAYPLPPAPPLLIAQPGHEQNYSHARYGSHGQQQSHFRFASHWPAMSHQRFGSHNQYWSHYQFASHNLKWSHNKYGSHGNKASHAKQGSHQIVASHFNKASKVHLLANSHKQFGSHNMKQSLLDKIKNPDPKPIHTIAKSLADKDIKVPPKHSIVKSALDKDIKIPDPKPVHTVAKSAVDKDILIPDPKPVHTVVKSALDKDIKAPGPKHNPIQSAVKDGKLKPKADPVHAPIQSAVQDGKLKPKDVEPVHAPMQSAIKDGKIKPKEIEPVHAPMQSAAKDGKIKVIHAPAQSAAKDGQKQKLEPAHNPAASNQLKARNLPAPKTLPEQKAINLPRSDTKALEKRLPEQRAKQPPVETKVQEVKKVPPLKPKHDPDTSVKTPR